MLVIMAGLPGSGKTTLAHELAIRTGGRVISKDAIRHALFTPNEIEYSTRQDDFCMQITLQVAAELLRNDRKRCIFLDGRTFSRRYQIGNVVRAADSLQQDWRVLECVCTEETARVRLSDQVLNSEHPALNRSFQLYLEVQSRFETIPEPKTVIDTSAAIETCVEAGLAALR